MVEEWGGISAQAQQRPCNGLSLFGYPQGHLARRPGSSAPLRAPLVPIFPVASHSIFPGFAGTNNSLY